MSSIGRLYVFEGYDGSGKTTLAREFTKALSIREPRVTYLAFPGQADGTLGKHVYGLHHAPTKQGIERIHPASLQILHIAAHIDSIETAILPALTRGDWVVLDRYWWSTCAYGVAAGVDPQSLKAMVDLELLHWKGVLPSAVFLIERAPARGQCQDMQRARILAEYESLADRERNKYPVHIVGNDGCLDVTLKTLLPQAQLPRP